jgi:uncharacterized protein (UPF0333 family)
MKAQVSFEFMVVFAALMMIFVAMFALYFGGSLNLFQAQDSAAAQRDAQSVAAAINYVYLAGDGASYDFTLANMAGAENVTISDYSVTSDRPKASASAPLLDAGTEPDSLPAGNAVISNNQGEINITE